MYCGECGTKNENGAAFCESCGAKLENNSPVNNKPKKANMSKNTKIVILVITILVATVIGLVVLFNNLTNPKNVAKDYIAAVVLQDGNKLYEYLNVEKDTTFASKKIFTEILKAEKSSTDIDNYKITDVSYSSSKLQATVNFKYTTKGSNSEKSSSVTLTKQKSKKYLFFDNWKINGTDVSTVKDFTLKVPKDSKVYYCGVKVTDKYKDSKNSISSYDAYVLPVVFAYKSKIKAELSSGIEIEDEVTPSTYYSTYTVKFSSDSLSDKEKDKIVKTGQDALTKIYQAAIANKGFNDIKSEFTKEGLDLSSLEKNYTSLAKSLSSSSSKLTSFKITAAEIYYVNLNSDGNLEVELKVNYEYETKYNSYSGEEKTNKDDSYSYMTIILGSESGSYYLIDTKYLKSYFY